CGGDRHHARPVPRPHSRRSAPTARRPAERPRRDGRGRRRGPPPAGRGGGGPRGTPARPGNLAAGAAAPAPAGASRARGWGGERVVERPDPRVVVMRRVAVTLRLPAFWAACTNDDGTLSVRCLTWPPLTVTSLKRARTWTAATRAPTESSWSVPNALQTSPVG